jgi:hypothetical protein
MCKIKEILLKSYPQFLRNSGSEKTVALVCSIRIYYCMQITKIFSSSTNSMIYYCTRTFQKISSQYALMSPVFTQKYSYRGWVIFICKSRPHLQILMMRKIIMPFVSKIVYEKHKVSCLKSSQPLPLYLLKLFCTIQNLK